MTLSVVTQQAELEAVCRELARGTWVGVDTEFLRVRTFYPRLCLLQVSSEDIALCVDPLSPQLSLAPIAEILTQAGLVKVFHSARQDLEVLFPILNDVVQPIFDTQIAAALLGYGAQIGYAALVQDKLGHPLAKSQTRTNWCARPLRAAQIRYAIDDVRYLGELHQALRTELDGRGRLSWAEEEFAGLVAPELYEGDADRAFKRLRRGHVLTVQGQALLKDLAVWREHTAQQCDLPRNWVATDAALFSMAQQAPATQSDLQALQAIDSKLAARYGNEILDLVARHRGTAPTVPVWEVPRRLTPKERSFCERLAHEVQRLADRQHIAAPLIATRRDLEQLVRGERDLALLAGWRRELIGARLEGLVAEWRALASMPPTVSA